MTTPEMVKASKAVQALSKSKLAQTGIFMVWVRKERPNGLENVDLRSVTTTRALADLHAEVIKRDEPDATGVWVEERACNHLYAQRDVRLAFRLLSVGNKWTRERGSE